MGYLTRLQANDDGRSEALRALGALLFGIGALVLLIRRGTLDNPWDDLPLLVAWLIPAVVLYGGGIAAARAAEPKGWHSVWVVFGILFVYGALLQFLAVIDADPDAPLNTAWTLCVVAAVAVVAAIVARVRFGWLVAGVALAIAWLSLWDEILENGVGDDAGTFRGLCMIAALLLVAGAWLLEKRRDDGEEAVELVTAAGLIFLLGAGVVSVTGVLGSIFAAGIPATGGAEPSLLWDVVLLGGSLALIGAGSIVRSRGPIYVGAIGILLFVALVGGDLDDDSPAGKVIGWP
ncbi:MAG: hypothetical protein WKF62_02135, partial [Solirubrobacterales bacterium]